MQIITRPSLSALMALTLLAAGCGSASKASSPGTARTTTPPPASTGAQPPETTHVVMQSLGFDPTSIRAKVGQTIVWSNEDNARHNVTYVSGPKFTSSRPIVSPSTRFSIKLTQPGTIHYVCTIHPWMKATIVVSP
jgi:plastocyanin